MSLFGFDESDFERRRKSWAHAEKRCGLKKKVKTMFNGDIIVTSFFEVGKTGKLILEIKEDPNNVPVFADNLCDYLDRTLGSNITKSGWCLITTPRRRHKEGFHFATEICRNAAEQIGIPFYSDAFESKNRNRIIPDFKMLIKPAERNVVIYDDIITTGQTIKTVRQMLVEAGYVTLLIVGIRNS